MTAWTGVVLAPRAPGEDGMLSRISTYLHPIAGRPLVWHTLAALAAGTRPPTRLVLLGTPELDPALIPALPIALDASPLEGRSGAEALAGADTAGGLLIADAAAPLIAPEVEPLLDRAKPTLLSAPGGEPLALWLPEGDLSALGSGVTLVELADAIPGLVRITAAPESALVVHDRASLAVAVGRVRDRLVRRLMDAGVTVLLPESVLLDVDARVGRDSVLYPGVILEGQTTVGEETVIGPGCRIIDSWIGSGVELKGWNFIAQTSVRNRAILEPYVRRGFD
jgi:hypothetical protein